MDTLLILIKNIKYSDFPKNILVCVARVRVIEFYIIRDHFVVLHEIS